MMRLAAGLPGARHARSLVNRPVFRNAASLYGSTIVTSVLGFAFWVLAARAFPQEGVGVASAAISAMQLLATLGIFGLGTLMIGELASGSGAKGLVMAALLTAAAACSMCAAVFLLVQPWLASELGPVNDGLVGPPLFVAGVALTGVTLVLDTSSIGLNRGGLQLLRNGVFSFVKLLLLVPLALMVTDAQASQAIYAAWLLGNVVSIGVLLVHARRTNVHPTWRPGFRALASIRGAAFAHHWLNLAAQAPRLLMPVLVAAMLSPSLNAAFYTAVLIVSFASMIPGHLSTALFALPRGDEDRLAAELRGTLRISAITGVVSAIVFAALAEPLLRIFGPGYTVAATSMAVYAFISIPFLIKVHYAAVCRVRGTIVLGAVVSTAGAVLEIGAGALGAHLGGLTGVSVGLLAALTLEALLLWPTVAGAARFTLLPARR